MIYGCERDFYGIVKRMTTKINTVNVESAECSQCTIRSRTLFGAVGEDKIRITQKYRDKHHFFSADDILHLEQQKIDYSFILRSGCLMLYNDLEDGSRQILQIALPGDFVGFSRNYKGELPYSIKAVTDVGICLFSDKSMQKMISEQPEIAKKLIDLQSGKLIVCQQHLLNLGKKTAAESLAYLIMELHARIKVQAPEMFNDEENEAFFPLNQEGIGDILGLTKVHINRVMTSFRKQGLIVFSYKKLKLLDEEKLSEIGKFDISQVQEPFCHFN
ncbi:Crp/Fnr family transcriptional regulator [Bathymodiolus thermophilus thioautotrophic gill symbiont]|nr:Crp/Fnr family transcriptional regulator [Bathymodiolus thermophilus thioautotrophic gill symbiont]